MNRRLAYVAGALLLVQTCIGCMQPPANLATPGAPVGSSGQNSRLSLSESSTPPLDAAAMSNAALADAVTAYLKDHDLPLVGANLVTKSDGTRNVILYGFTATDYGKSDAVRKTQHLLNDPSIEMTNRIVVRPELAQMKAPQDQQQSNASTANPSGSGMPSSIGGVQSYENQQSFANAPQQSANQSGSWWSTLLPLAGLGGLLSGGSAGFGGFGGSAGFGSFGGAYPPFGPAYPGYPGYGPAPGYPGYGTPYPGYPPPFP